MKSPQAPHRVFIPPKLFTGTADVLVRPRAKDKIFISPLKLFTGTADVLVRPRAKDKIFIFTLKLFTGTSSLR